MKITGNMRMQNTKACFFGALGKDMQRNQNHSKARLKKMPEKETSGLMSHPAPKKL